MSSSLPNPALIPPAGVGPAQGVPAASGTGTRSDMPVRGPAFADILAKSQTSEPPRFTRHALERLQRRGIDLGSQTIQRLSGAVARASSKGSRDSVIFVDGTAFVVSVRNNTVITAVGPENMRDHVFTNIDSAVIA
jgi:flagellar operon protein